MRRMTSLGLVFCIGVTLAATAQAKPDKDAEVKLDANLPVAAQVSAIEKAIDSEDYSEIAREDKTNLQQALGRIQTRLGDQERVDQLDPQGRAEILKDQDVVNTILARAWSDSRMVCSRERTVGSNMAKRVCTTAAQRRRIDEASRRSFEDSNRTGNLRR